MRLDCNVWRRSRPHSEERTMGDKGPGSKSKGKKQKKPRKPSPS